MSLGSDFFCIVSSWNRISGPSISQASPPWLDKAVHVVRIQTGFHHSAKGWPRQRTTLGQPR